MDIEISNESRRRYYVEDVVHFVEQALAYLPEDQHIKWARLPVLLRAHPYPFFYVTPSTRIVDLVKDQHEAERAG